MRVLNLAHAGMNVADMKKTLHFYCDILGMNHTFSLKRYGKPWIEYVEYGEKQFLEFFYTHDQKLEIPNMRQYYAVHHLAFVVDDIHDMEKICIENGVRIKTSPLLGPDHTWQMWIYDPDGNEIEIMEYTEKSFQLTGGKQK